MTLTMVSVHRKTRMRVDVGDIIKEGPGAPVDPAPGTWRSTDPLSPAAQSMLGEMVRNGETGAETIPRKRSHCGRDPSVIGACGGTDETCSCECSSCQDPR